MKAWLTLFDVEMNQGLYLCSTDLQGRNCPINNNKDCRQKQTKAKEETHPAKYTLYRVLNYSQLILNTPKQLQ